VDRHVGVASDLGSCGDLVDGDRRPAAVVVGVLQRQESGAGPVEVLLDEPLSDRLGRRDAAIARIDRSGLGARELRRARQLPPVDVRLAL